MTGSAVKIGGLAAIGGVHQAYKNYQAGKQPSETANAEPELLPPPADTGFHPDNAPQGDADFTLDAGARHDCRSQGGRAYRRRGAPEDRRLA